MLRFPKQITSEFIEYASSSTKEEFCTQLEGLFAKTKGFNFSINLTGEFTNMYEFSVTSKWEIGISKNFLFHKSTNLKGYIFTNSTNKTQINLLITPFSIFPLLFIILPIFLLFFLFIIEPGRLTTLDYIFIISLVVASPFIIMKLSSFSKYRLLNRFTNYFKLKKIGF